jgi:methyl-accepting chemotaxis protein
MNLLLRILTPLTLTVVIGVGAIITLSISGTSDVRSAYSAFIDGTASAVIDMRRANQFVANMSGTAYQAVTEGQPSGARALKGISETFVAGFREAIASARAKDSKLAGPLSEVSRIFDDELEKRLNRVYDLAILNKDGDTVSYLGSDFVPVIGRLTMRLKATMNDAESRMKRELQETRDATALTQRLMWVGSVLALALLVTVLGIVIHRTASRPLVLLAQSMKSIVDGHLDTAIPLLDRKDEVGRMAQALLVFRESAVRMLEFEREKVRLEEAAEHQRSHTIANLSYQLQSGIQTIAATLGSAAQKLEDNSLVMQRCAGETQQRTNSVASASQEAAESVQAVAAATEELNISISQIGQQLRETAQLAVTARIQSTDTTATVKTLSDAVLSITEIVGIISDIASQTNLLALNASIEAARAGDAGRGFAVVAQEVKALANQTASATDEIASHIGSVRDATDKVIGSIHLIVDSIENITTIAGYVAAAVEQQSAATDEIANNASRASASAASVFAHAGGMSSAALQTGSAATDVLTAAQLLSFDAQTLDVTIVDLIRKIQTA